MFYSYVEISEFMTSQICKQNEVKVKVKKACKKNVKSDLGKKIS